MTSTMFGGGPTIEQTRAFASFQDGAQVPGYDGFIPQLRFRKGQTYGQETSDLSKEFALNKCQTAIGKMEPDPPPTLRNIPRSTGDNKYTDNMKPGYTGYMPRGAFNFGNSYKEGADLCIDDFRTRREAYSAKLQELKSHTAAHPRLVAVSYDPQVRDVLNSYRDTHPVRPIMMDDKRGLYEAPIPGYQGFIPRIQPTQIGLSKRYKIRAQKGLDQFAQDQDKLLGPERLSSHQFNALHLGNFHDAYKDGVPYQGPNGPDFSRRIYPNCGMIPKYTGYVPQKRYSIGKTVGDTTRSLIVCKHDKRNYGEFVKTQPFPLPTVPC